MSGEKICPFMSRPYLAEWHTKDDDIESETSLHVVECQRERCMAWGGTIGQDSGCKLIRGRK